MANNGHMNNYTHWHKMMNGERQDDDTLSGHSRMRSKLMTRQHNHTLGPTHKY